MKHMNRAIITFVLLFSAIAFLPIPYYQNEDASCKPDQTNCPKAGWHLTPPLGVSIWAILTQQNRSNSEILESPSPTREPINEDNPSITIDTLQKGWYWGMANQKKPGTPADWVYQEAGRSSCWHAPNVPCTETTYTCPVGGWENCMPILTPEAQKQCTKEAIEWKKKFCPGFQGAAL